MMEETLQKDEFDKLIELKKLEIEKLRLEQARGYGQQFEVEKYQNLVWKNGVVLLVIGISVFLPWGSLDGRASYGGYSSSSSFGATGFQLGLLSFTWPFLIILILSFIFAILNKVRELAVTSVLGVLLSVWTLSVLDKMGITVSFVGASASSSFNVSAVAFIPLVGFILLLFNFFVKKKNSVSLHNEILHKQIAKTTGHNAYIKQQEYIKKKALEIKEKNKTHYQNDKILKIVLILSMATELIIIVSTFIVDKYYSHGVQFSGLVLLSISCDILCVYKGDLITSNRNKLIAKSILGAFFFIVLIYDLLRSSFNNRLLSTSELAVMSLIFIGAGATLYLSLIALSCITLNKNAEENDHV